MCSASWKCLFSSQFIIFQYVFVRDSHASSRGSPSASRIPLGTASGRPYVRQYTRRRDERIGPDCVWLRLASDCRLGPPRRLTPPSSECPRGLYKWGPGSRILIQHILICVCFPLGSLNPTSPCAVSLPSVNRQPNARRSMTSMKLASCLGKFLILDKDSESQISRRQHHRGPDFCGAYQDKKTGDILVHERLAIMDLGISHPIQGTCPTSQVSTVTSDSRILQ